MIRHQYALITSRHFEKAELSQQYFENDFGVHVLKKVESSKSKNVYATLLLQCELIDRSLNKIIAWILTKDMNCEVCLFF